MGVLRVNVGGTWVDVVGASGGGAEEVAVGPDDPITTVPTAELWYDTDAPAGVTGVGIPSAGTAGQVLTKTTGTDYDASWQSSGVTAAIDASGRGVVAYVRKPSDTTVGPSDTIIIDNTAAAHVAGRRYRFTIEMLFGTNVATDLMNLFLKNVGDGLTYKRWVIGPTTGGFNTTTVSYITESSLAAGTATWRIDGARAGSGTMTAYGYANVTPVAAAGNATRYCSLLVEDIGPL